MGDPLSKQELDELAEEINAQEKRILDRALKLAEKDKQMKRTQSRARRYRPLICDALDKEDLQIHVLKNCVDFHHVKRTYPKDAVFELWDELDF